MSAPSARPGDGETTYRQAIRGSACGLAEAAAGMTKLCAIAFLPRGLSLTGFKWHDRSEGTGVIELNDGKVTGGDTVFAYSGSYFQDGDKFSASLTTQRHTPGQPSVFDIDNVDLTVTGKSTTAACTGTAKQAPGLAFEAIFVRIADEPRALPRAPTRPRSPASVILNPSQIARDARSKR